MSDPAPAMSPPHHIYQPLPPNEIIHILKVHSAKTGDELSGELLLCTLEDNKASHSYTAMSYVWDDSHSCESISIGTSDVQRLRITASAKEVLTRLRKSDEEVLVWFVSKTSTETLIWTRLS